MKKLYRCTVCGFVCEGDEAPQLCAKCNAAKDKFVELSNEERDKIYNSDRTNDIHSEIIVLAGKIFELCKEGIDIKLDPKCVSAFEKAKDELWTIKQRSKAELAGHMSNGKW